MREQLTYTACRRSIDCDTEGMQIYAYSEGISQESKIELPRMGAYSLSGTSLKAQITDYADVNNYPIAFRYYNAGPGRILMTSSRYLGMDWSQTRYSGNYLSSAIETDMLPHYPMEYYDTKVFSDNIHELDVASESRPSYMSQPILSLDESRPIRWDILANFLRDGHINDVKVLISSILPESAKVVITGNENSVPLWMGAATMILPKGMTASLAISTFGKFHKDLPHTLTCSYEVTGKYSIVSGVEDVCPFIDWYVDWILSEEGRYDNFMGFLNRFCLDASNVDELEEVISMFLMDSNDSAMVDRDRLRKCLDIAIKNPTKIGDRAIANLLQALWDVEDQQVFMKDYDILSKYVKNQKWLENLFPHYCELMIDSLGKIESPEIVLSKSNPYIDIISRCLSEKTINAITSPGMGYLVYRCWINSRDADYYNLLLSMSPDISVNFAHLLVKIDKDLKYDGERNPFNEYVLKELQRFKISNTSNLGDNDILMIGKMVESDPDYARIMFESSVNKSVFPKIVKEFISHLDYEGQYTFSDAVTFCIDSGKCPYGVLFEEFDYRYLSTDNEDVIRTIRAFNDEINPGIASKPEQDIIKVLKDRYPNYSLCLDGFDRILAASVAMNHIVKPEDMPPNLNYRPPIDELTRFIARLIDHKVIGHKWYAALFDMMGVYHRETVQALCKCFEKSETVCVPKLAEFIIASVSMPLKDEELELVFDMYGKWDALIKIKVNERVEKALMNCPEKIECYQRYVRKNEPQKNSELESPKKRSRSRLFV